MDVFDVIRARRSIKRFSGVPVRKEEIEALLELAIFAPNHRMTEPWKFLVMGGQARRRFGEVKGDRRAAKIEDPVAAEEVRRKAIAETEAIPVMIAFVQRIDPNPEIREEDFASVYMAMQNLLLGATAMGLGTHVKTGAIFDAPQLREALGVEEDERIVALVDLGNIDGDVPTPTGKVRIPATELTRWIE